MKTPVADGRPQRIALVWDSPTLVSRRVLEGLYRRASIAPGLVLRHFDGMKAPFQKSVLAALRAWKPAGIVVRLGEVPRIAAVRKAFPRVPLIATNYLPAAVADCIVTSDLEEAARSAIRHFRDQGLSHVGLLCAGNKEAAGVTTRLIRDLEPGGFIFTRPLHIEGVRATPHGGFFRALSAWLRSLPKPVGIYTHEPFVARYAVRVCQMIGLRIPDTVQLLAPDELDECMECHPHLSSLDLPFERIGETALETLLARLRGEPVPPLVRVGGVRIVPRGSTGPVTRVTREISNALGMIRTGAARGLTAAGLIGRTCKSSPATFYRTFRAATGSTPARLLLEARIREAERKLVETTASVTTISDACGFHGSNYFAQVFRRETGLSPTQYRARHARGTGGS